MASSNIDQRSPGQAMWRGALCKCPHCGRGRLFRAYLKVADQCNSCGELLNQHRADDFPPYVSIFVTGHVMAPLIILLVSDAGLSIMAALAILLPLAVAIMLAILQPAKGAVIAMQYWLGLSGFAKERPLGADDAETL